MVQPPGSGSDPLSLLSEEDFFLFPTITSPRFSYASSPESEVEVDASDLKDATSSSGGVAVTKSTSDPSIDSPEDMNGSVQVPNYNAPPPYSVMGSGSNGFVQVLDYYYYHINVNNS